MQRPSQYILGTGENNKEPLAERRTESVGLFGEQILMEARAREGRGRNLGTSIRFFLCDSQCLLRLSQSCKSIYRESHARKGPRPKAIMDQKLARTLSLGLPRSLGVSGCMLMIHSGSVNLSL